ncbi:Adenylate cyclase type 2, partial [Armadillidium nasatum]
GLYHERYNSVGVMFASIPNYTEFYDETDVNKQGLECLRLLNEIICDYDKVRDRTEHYLVILVEFALALASVVDQINKESFQNFKLRVGLAHGPVVAGVVGAQKPQYDIWGNTVNVASRMDSCGFLGRIQVTEETAKVLIDAGWNCYCRGPTLIKGKGTLTTYIVQPPQENESLENKSSKLCGVKNEDCGALLKSPFFLPPPNVPNIIPSENPSPDIQINQDSPNDKIKKESSKLKKEEPIQRTEIQSTPKITSDTSSVDTSLVSTSSVPIHSKEVKSSEHNEIVTKNTKPVEISCSFNSSSELGKNCDLPIIPSRIRSNSQTSNPIPSSNFIFNNECLRCRTGKPKPVSCVLKEKPFYMLHLHKRKTKSVEDISTIDKTEHSNEFKHSCKKLRADSQVVMVGHKTHSKLCNRITNSQNHVHQHYPALVTKSLSNTQQRGPSPSRISRRISVDSNFNERLNKIGNSGVPEREYEFIDGKCHILIPKSTSKKRAQVFV